MKERDQELSSSVLPVLCGKDGRWKTRLEELLQPNQVVVLLSLGDIKYDTLSYLNTHPNTQIPEMTTKYHKRERRDLAKSKGQVKRK